MKRLLLSSVLCILFALSLQAQLSGTIADSLGRPLPFASVYIKGTTIGTSANSKGAYQLSLAPGRYEIIFHYVGFEQKMVVVDMGQKTQALSINLREEAIRLSEFVLSSNAEDPAYPIIRKAIEKRTFFRDQVPEFICNTYVKGNIKMVTAPKKIMGREVGNLRGILDTNRQGILYLSESQSKLYFTRPNKFKEEMIYTKVSGNDQGFGFNRAEQMNFSLYDAYSELGRNIVSPINDNAFAYYKFRLVGTITDNPKFNIYKIEVIPKRSEDPVYRGFIYIVDGKWNIQSTDLLLTAGAIKQPGMDTLNMKQVYVPIAGSEDVWRVFSNNINFRAGAFGFKLGGNFTCVYSGYNLDPKLGTKFFSNEVFIVHEGANEQPLAFWDSIRPIPLTLEESKDYIKKDSLQKKWESKSYMDSLDAKSNKFKVMNILTGYSYNQTYKKQYFRIDPPLYTIQFNTVQGWNLFLNGSYRKEYDRYNMRWWSIKPKLNYGFSDKNLRYAAEFTYHFDQNHSTEMRVSGGREATQFNGNNPITPTLNSLYTLYGRNNYLKIYDKSYLRTYFQRELINGIFLSTSLEYANRAALKNNSNYSFSDEKRRNYTSNDPQNPQNFDAAFANNKALIFDVALRFRLKQEYISYPGRKYIDEVKGPDFFLAYTKGISALGSAVNFDLLRLRIQESNLRFKAWGYSEIRAEAGLFLNKKSVFFTDYVHFNGNQTNFGSAKEYYRSFLRLPYYAYSTQNRFVQLHWQHHFEGAILDLIPGVNKLGWKLVSGAHFLATPTLPRYLELTLGIENIGIKVIRPLRVDLVASIYPNNRILFAPVISISL
jgi:hypothetical protein